MSSRSGNKYLYLVKPEFMRTLMILLGFAMGIACNNPTARANVSQTDTVLICKSKNAHTYHRYECRGLKHCTYTVIKMTKAQAIKSGYRACKFCYR